MTEDTYPTVTVMAGWRSPDRDIVLGHHVGILLAQHGYAVAFGGGGSGCMGAVALAAHRGGAPVLAITKPEWVEPVDAQWSLITAPTLTSRMALLESVAGAYLVLPGGRGTETELDSVRADRCNGDHCKPIIVCDPFDHWADKWKQDKKYVQYGYAKPDPLPVYRSAEKAIAALVDQFPPPGITPRQRRRLSCIQGFARSR